MAVAAALTIEASTILVIMRAGMRLIVRSSLSIPITLSALTITYLLPPLSHPTGMPHLPGLKRSPESNLDITRESQFDQYNEWTEAPVKLQVVDPVGVPIFVGEVTRDTTIDQLRNKVEAAVRERHAAVLSGPRHSEGGGHRTYTVLAELGLYKIKNYDDAFSGRFLSRVCAPFSHSRPTNDAIPFSIHQVTFESSS